MSTAPWSRAWVVAIVLAAAAAMVPQTAQAIAPATATITGRVVNSEGVAIQNATVILANAEGMQVGRMYSRIDGSFSFPKARPGAYKLIAYKWGVGRCEYSGNIKPNGFINVRMTLVRQPPATP
jgi:hypothetical protein